MFQGLFPYQIDDSYRGLVTRLCESGMGKVVKRCQLCQVTLFQSGGFILCKMVA